MTIQEPKYTISRQNRDFVALKADGQVFANVLYLEQASFLLVVYDRYSAIFKTAEEAISYAKKIHPIFKDLMARGKFFGGDNKAYPQAQAKAPNVANNLKMIMSVCEELLINIEETDIGLLGMNQNLLEQLYKNIQSDLTILERELLETL